MSYLIAGFIDEKAGGRHAAILKEFHALAVKILADYPQSSERGKALQALEASKEQMVILARRTDKLEREVKHAPEVLAASAAPASSPAPSSSGVQAAETLEEAGIPEPLDDGLL